jgi:rare lipoprotein A (peptidoglycan hydrolase)
MLIRKDIPVVASNKVMDAAARMSDHAVRMSSHAASTVRVIITAEERVRQRIRSVLRVGLATVFLGISGLISLGANVTTAFAKKVTPHRGSNNTLPRGKHAGLQIKAISHRHSSKRHYRVRGRLAKGKSNSSMRGVASWYGNEFHNRKTASGVLFNTHAMMAAHRTLPFGTKVRVTNLANSKSCIVEITDRGPFSHNRIIDLSYAAAEELGMMESGITKVQLEVISATQQLASQELSFVMQSPVSDRLTHRAVGYAKP